LDEGRFENRLTVSTYLEALSRGYAYRRREDLPRKLRAFEDLAIGLGLADVRITERGEVRVLPTDRRLITFLLSYKQFRMIGAEAALRICIEVLEDILEDLKARAKAYAR